MKSKKNKLTVINKGDLNMRKLFFLAGALIIFSTSLSFAQFQKEEEITDLLTLHNRMDWRIDKINRLVTKHKSDKEYKRLVYEIEKFTKILDQAEKNLKPENRVREFEKLLSEMRSTCSELVAQTLDKKDDEIKVTTNKFFVKYTSFKQCLKKAERERKLTEQLERSGK